MKKSFLLLTFTHLILFAKAQHFEPKWSSLLEFDKNKTGFIDQFIGANDKYLYLKLVNDSYSPGPNHSPKQIRLYCFDRITLQQVGDVGIIGFEETREARKEMKGMIFLNVVVMENHVHVFWRKESSEKEELYVQSFNSALKPEKTIRKITERAHFYSIEKNYPNIQILTCNKIKSKLVLGYEADYKEHDEVKYHYKVIDENLNFLHAGIVTIPYKPNGWSHECLYDYSFEEDEHIYVKSTVIPTNIPEKEANSFLMMSRINPFNESIQVVPIQLDNKKINSFYYFYDTTSKNIRCYGFYGDVLPGKKHVSNNGIFTFYIDYLHASLFSKHFASFNQELLDKLFKDDAEDRKKDNSIDDAYSIETINVSSNQLTFYCTIKANTATVGVYAGGGGYGYSSGGGVICYKKNITTFNISLVNGAITWSSNIDRLAIYVGESNVKDLHPFTLNNKAIIIYNSDYELNAEKKNMFSKKKSDYKTDHLEYAILNTSNGTYEQKEYLVNAPDATEKKSINPAYIVRIDNEYFFYCIIDERFPKAKGYIGKLEVK